MNSSDYNVGNIKFLTKSCNSLTEQELQQCSELFSKHYGNWALNNPKHKQGPVKLGVKYYKDTMIKPDHYVSLAYDNDLLIGHAFYIRKKFDNAEYMSWVLQLVVHTNYRMRSIGKTLLYSIWGFSGDVARGLATSNPYTVKTLESVTFRKANPEIIYKNLDIIKKIGAEVSFMDDEKPYKVNLQQSIVDTDFYVDHSDIGDKIKKAYDDKWQLGELPEGHEWLAFTFKDQELREFTKNEFTKWIEYSEKELIEAYARMDTEKQPWAKIENTRSEVDFIMKKVGLYGKEKIADFGCGIGRHCIEFANRNYNVTGIDFVKSNIEKANLKANENNLVDVKFIEADCRTIELDEKCDLITCLYDVVGSFPNEADNRAILINIYSNLKKGGHAVISVMNMELTEKIAKNIEDIFSNPKSLLNLKPSKIMQTNGNIFDPDYYIIDRDSRIVYRKEQFDDDGMLSAEHIIRDKRYTKKEIIEIVQHIGFEVIDVRFVSAGKWDIKLSNISKRAKEILLVLKK